MPQVQADTAAYFLFVTAENKSNLLKIDAKLVTVGMYSDLRYMLQPDFKPLTGL